MAQMYFYTGPMASGKSMDLLKAAHNYTEQNKRVILMTSATDTRNGIGKINSRIGLSKSAYAIESEDNIVSLYDDILSDENDSRDVVCILVDEAQFLTREHVKQLSQLVLRGIPVLAYGLKNDFSNRLFEGSESLLIYADKIKPIKTVCWHPSCGKKAIMNARIDDEGNILYEGEQIQIGGNESYIPVCRKHYYNYS